MNKATFDELLLDVSSHFSTPTEIVNASSLTRDQKLALLEQWDYDLRLLLTASAENMPGEGNAEAAERIRQVHKAAASLGRPLETGDA